MPKQIGRPHLIGIDDGPFDKGQASPAPLVAVLMEGPDLVEGVATRWFPIDGDGATELIANWITGLRARPALDGIVLGGITVAGLGVIDVNALSGALALPVLVVNRRDPAEHTLDGALRAAGLVERIATVAATPPSLRVDEHLFLACAGAPWERGRDLVLASRSKSALPEPLRVAHLVAAAIARGESRGRA